MNQPNFPTETRLALAGPSEEQLVLLGTDPASLAMRDALMQVTHHLYRTTLRVQLTTSYYERMSNPQPGDFVMESSRGWWASSPETRMRSFGVLLGVRNELGNDRKSRAVTYVQYGPHPGQSCRWEEGIFVLVPTDFNTFEV